MLKTGKYIHAKVSICAQYCIVGAHCLYGPKSQVLPIHIDAVSQPCTGTGRAGWAGYGSGIR